MTGVNLNRNARKDIAIFPESAKTPGIVDKRLGQPNRNVYNDSKAQTVGGETATMDAH